ncbi:MAG: hypothetical protein JSV05_07190 [Candidatus Bathyarchaeota archaeon]|nr:MAG: hypothetical protein JSV05_07190 [Candidatus Bathyarchaeota archaeon]
MEMTWLVQAIITVLWNHRGFFFTSFGMMGALYIAELMAVGKKRSSIKITIIIALLYSLIAEISTVLLSPIPILVVFVQIISLALLIQYYYEGDWVTIFAVALVAAFILIMIMGLSTAFFESPRPF